ncbi:MAG: 4-phosphopantoate--beta-alanine ligase [Candidatus Omnitrophota bacterium]|nr:MAG: 4-phosphopantoate--beta-alanine ligase [Candidatus Omnitrophota bacterium]
MITTASIAKTRKILTEARKKGKKICFVPTMGALHKGHLSLVRSAKRQKGFVVVSIFVNPTQFSPGEDYLRYPRRPAKDSSFLRKEKVDLLFIPKVDLIYPVDFSTSVEEFDLSMLESREPNIHDLVWEVILKRGQDTTFRFADYDPASFERAIGTHAPQGAAPVRGRVTRRSPLVR